MGGVPELEFVGPENRLSSGWTESSNGMIANPAFVAASQSCELLKDDEQDQSVRISTVLGKLDEISNDPNIPVHARTLIWEVLSKLEAI